MRKYQHKTKRAQTQTLFSFFVESSIFLHVSKLQLKYQDAHRNVILKGDTNIHCSNFSRIYMSNVNSTFRIPQIRRDLLRNSHLDMEE